MENVTIKMGFFINWNDNRLKTKRHIYLMEMWNRIYFILLPNVLFATFMEAANERGKLLKHPVSFRGYSRFVWG